MVEDRKKRFIAGAICPACNREDTIFMLKSENRVSRHCIECDFSEGLEELDNSSPVGEWSPVRLTNPK